MSKKTSYAVDNNGALVAAGLTILVGTVVGVGLWRRGSDSGRSKLAEASEYRGFKYRVEEWPVGSGVAYLGIVPIQQVGGVQVTEDEANLLASLDDARRFIQRLIDAKLPPMVDQGAHT
jgi:hypothetical protein